MINVIRALTALAIGIISFLIIAIMCVATNISILWFLIPGCAFYITYMEFNKI